MLLLLSLCTLGKSSDYVINFTQSYYDLFLNSSGVFIRQQNEENNFIVYESINIEDFTVHLSIGLYFDESKEDQLLNIAVESMKVNLDLEIEYLNKNHKYPGISVHDKNNLDFDYYNYYTITIHSDTIFYYDTKDWGCARIESYTANNQLIGRLFPSDLFSDSRSYICYSSTECAQKYSIGPYDSYFIATDDTMLNMCIDNIPLNEEGQAFYVLFAKNADFPHLNDKITDKTVHITGISANPVQLSIEGEINIDHLAVSNAQFRKKNADEPLSLHFASLSLEDGTKDVFPAEETNVSCGVFYERRQSGDESQFRGVVAAEGGFFYVSPDFEENGDVVLNVKSDVIEVVNSGGKTVATVPVFSSHSKAAVIIDGQKNLNNSKITIKNGFSGLGQGLQDSLEIIFENCGQIPIEFVDWSDEKLSDFQFSISNDQPGDYDVIIANRNSSFLRYSASFGDAQFTFPDDAKSVVVCLKSDTCSEDELAGNNVYQHPINGESASEINAILGEFLSEKTEIESLFLVLGEGFREEALALPVSIGKLKHLSFVCNGEGSELLPVNLSSFPAGQIDLEVRKCSVSVSSDSSADINQLFTSESGEISGDHVKVNENVAVQVVDISSSEQTVSLSGSSKKKLLIKSGKSPRNLIFTGSGQFSCTVFVQCLDGVYVDVPISFAEEQLEGEPSKLQIRTLNHERVSFASIPTKIETTVASDDTDVVQHHIPAKSEGCNQDKVLICYNGNLCNSNFKYKVDEMYFSSINENDFASIIGLLKRDQAKVYQNIRLLFNPLIEYEDVSFSQIPSNQVKQLRLTPTEPGDVYLILSDDVETESFTKWLLDPNVFFLRSRGNKLYYFEDISTNFANEDSILEIFDDLYENYRIETFHLSSAYSSVYDYLVDSNLIVNFGRLVFDMTPNNNNECFIQYADNKIALDGPLSGNGNTISNPKEPSKIYLQILDNGNDNDQVVTIDRVDGSIDQANLIIAKKTGTVTVNFTCSQESVSSNFELNLFKMNDVDVRINQDKCSNVDSYIIQNKNEVVPDSPTQSSSETFEFTSNVCKHNEKGQNKEFDTSQVSKITFTRSYIIITEKGSSGSSTPFYFVSHNEKPRILVKKDVVNSNIGVASDNSPRVILEKDNYPLSFLNDLAEGGFIEIKLQQEAQSVRDLVFREMNNLRGSFHLYLPLQIASVSFTSVRMSQASSLEARSRDSSSSALKLQSESSAAIRVQSAVDVSPASEATITNLNLGGNINIYDNSQLKLRGNTVFSDTSKINLIVREPAVNRLIIECEKLTSIPSSIVVSSDTQGQNVDLNGLQIIGPIETQEMCETLRTRTVFGEGEDPSYEAKCAESDGRIVLALQAKEEEKKSKKKLSGGAIAGIVIACVVVLAIIVAVIIYFVKCKKEVKYISDNHNYDDDSCGL